jgi:hypothetical protein
MMFVLDLDVSLYLQGSLQEGIILVYELPMGLIAHL